MQELLEGATERRGLEFKEPFRWEKGITWIEECLIRAILAMANRPQGGRIVIGIAEDKQTKKNAFVGLTQAEVDSFEDTDHIKSKVDSFSYTGIDFEVMSGPFLGKSFVVFEVTEFDELPVICKEQGVSHLANRKADGTPGTPVLEKDTIYARSIKGQISSKRATDAELREIIRLATDKEHIQWTARQMRAAGYAQSKGTSPFLQDNPFDAQVEGIYVKP
jgi:hypothetical protein